MKGGDLHWIWGSPYAFYQEVDYLYGIPALENNDGFTNAQAFMNVVESVLNLTYVYLAHGAQWSGAPVIAYGTAFMTLGKTTLYWLSEYYCGFCQIGHNDILTLATYWISAMVLWTIIPSLIIWVLGKDIVQSLTITSSPAKVTSKKIN